MKKLLVIILAVTTLCFLAGCAFEKETLITFQSSPDGNRTVYLYQTGSPQEPLDSVNAKWVLKDSNDKKIDEEKFDLANKGARVSKENIKQITWLENQVEIIMGEFDTTQEFTCILSYAE